MTEGQKQGWKSCGFMTPPLEFAMPNEVQNPKHTCSPVAGEPIA